MIALKLVTLLFLALAVVGLNVQSSHQNHHEHRSSVTFKITETYSLPSAPANIWSDFPGLAGDFEVGWHNVLVSYNIQTYTASTSYFVVRVLIDGEEDSRFRTISAGTVFKSLSITLPVYLNEGTHSIKVQFRCVGAVTNVPYEDWEQAFLQINYLWFIYTQLSSTFFENLSPLFIITVCFSPLHPG